MSEKHSIASKNRWANIPKEERSRIMSERAKERAVKMTKEQLHNHALMMNSKKKEIKK